MMLPGQQENQMSNQYEPVHQFYHAIPTEQPKKDKVCIVRNIANRNLIKKENSKQNRAIFIYG